MDRILRLGSISIRYRLRNHPWWQADTGIVQVGHAVKKTEVRSQIVPTWGVGLQSLRRKGDDALRIVRRADWYAESGESQRRQFHGVAS